MGSEELQIAEAMMAVFAQKRQRPAVLVGAPWDCAEWRGPSDPVVVRAVAYEVAFDRASNQAGLSCLRFAV